MDLRVRLNSPQFFWSALIIMLIIQTVMGYQLRDVGGQLVSLQLTCDPRAFQAVLTAWTSEQLAQYQSHFLPDFFYPLAYGSVLASLMAKMMIRHQRSHLWNRLLWLPGVAILTDYAENTLHLLMSHQGTLSAPHLVPVAFGFALVKWGVLVGLILGLLMARILPARP
jgi:hypothetical protein